MNLHYTTITNVFDFGPHISKVILNVDRELTDIELSPDQFSVTVDRVAMSGKDFVWPTFMGTEFDQSMHGTREIMNLYVSDSDGQPSFSGKYITLELNCDPRRGIGSIIRFDGKFNVFVKVSYTIKQLLPLHTANGTIDGLIFTENDGNRIIYGDQLKKAVYRHSKADLSYMYYQPEGKDEEKIPLIIWLHGAGEGGFEPLIAAVGNKAVSFLSPDIQNIFGGKIYLLVPQSSTMWMDDGSGSYTTDGTSKYLEPLDDLIRTFIEMHSNIDLSRIYIGGCSNGGYMTMKLILHNPKRYAAAFPICEALEDALISDEDIQKISEIPIWFTHAKNDPIVPPEQYVLPTYERLCRNGNQNVHFTFWDKILDHTGLYKTENNMPYEYMGHWAWIPALNNECILDYDGTPVTLNGEPVYLFNWLAAQKRTGMNNYLIYFTVNERGC